LFTGAIVKLVIFISAGHRPALIGFIDARVAWGNYRWLNAAAAPPPLDAVVETVDARDPFSGVN
jgi:hypothetical protein